MHLTDILSECDCRKILESFNPCHTLIEYSLVPFSDEVVGFLAQHYRLTVTTLDRQGQTHILMLFMKCLPWTNTGQMDYVKKMNVFEKESIMYKNLISEFLVLVSENFAPKYYFSKADKFIVLEELDSKGFRTCEFGCWPIYRAQQALKTIARLHAASIIFEEKRSTDGEPFRIPDKYPEEVAEITFTLDETKIRYLWLHSVTKCLENLSVLYTSNKDVPKKLKEYIFSEMGLITSVQPSKKYRNVVCHDDLWSNNLLFNNEGQSRIVDFQLTRYAPPALDILLMLYMNLDSEVLKSSMCVLLDQYYEALRYELSLHNLDAEKLLPRKELLETVDVYKLPALIESCMFGTNVYISKEMSNYVMQSLENIERFNLYDRWYFVNKELECNPRFKERFDHVLKPLFAIVEEM